MFLTEKSTSPLAFLLFFPSKNSLPSPSLPFDHDLGARLRSLLPIPNSPFSVPLSWLSRAVDLLTLTLGDAAALMSDTSLSGADRAAIAAHLDSGVALLDACNGVAAHIDCLRRRRRLLRFALHLLSFPSSSSSPDSLRRAHEAIVELDWSPRHAINDSAGELARSLAPTVTPRGKISAVRRAIYAVEAVSSLVLGAIVAVLGGGEKADLAGINISGEFPWAEAFNKVSAAVSDELGEGFAGEMEAVEASVGRLVMDGEDDGKKTEGLRSTVKDADKAMEEMTDGLDRLSAAVNGLFRVALYTRGAALRGFRIVPKSVNRFN